MSKLVKESYLIAEHFNLTVSSVVYLRIPWIFKGIDLYVQW